MNARLEQIAKRAYSSLETIQASYDHARLAIQNGVPGDFVECGVAAGANAAAMALAIWDDDAGGSDEGEADQPTFEYTRRLPGNANRRVHLFDSFTGIPQAGPEDVEFLAAGHQAGLTAYSRAQVEANLKEWGLPLELFVFHEGMFADTIPNIQLLGFNWREASAQIKSVAVLRLDGDLYESTKVCIDHLFPLVSKGGWIIVDDWDLSGARKAVLEAVGNGFGPIYFGKI